MGKIIFGQGSDVGLGSDLVVTRDANNNVVLTGDANPLTTTIPMYYPAGSDCVLYHAYWDGSCKDHSLGGNDGTPHGSPSFGPTGIFLNAPAKYVEVADNTSLHANVTRSVMAWLKPVSTGIHMTLLTKPSAGEYYEFVDSPTPGNKSYRTLLGGGNQISGNDIYTDNVWTLIGYTAKDFYPVTGPSGHYMEFQFYKNGGTFGSVLTSDSRPMQASTTDSLRIGYFDGANNPYNGTIGELYIFNSQMTTASVLALFDGTKSRYGL
jgi:hypothetical protein